MNPIRIFLLLLVLSGKPIFAQLTTIDVAHPLHQFESRLMNGDKAALFEIAPYFDSKKKVIEYMGYHQVETTESAIAKRIVSENCLFTSEEIVISSSSSKKFLAFLDSNKEKIVFDKLAAAFLVTPLDQREVHFEIREISETKKQELKDSTETLLRPDWVKKNNIDGLIRIKDPKALLLIASEFFKTRDRFNRYFFYGDEFTDLLQLLTGTDIGVENEKKEITWHIDKDFNPESKLNLLIYFSKYYKQYAWDDQQSAFVNPNVTVALISKEDRLFQRLSNKNDSIALDAFTQLTVCDPGKVTKLADEYEEARIDKSYAIPIFPYKFLKQLVLLTDYCKTNKIDFTGTKTLQENIKLLLRWDLSFTKRRKLEDSLINTLTLDDITAFEYWSLIHEQSWGLTYSAGRILDIFYSKNWNKMLADEKQLDCYLKKSALFNHLGIIGICNNYLVKFSDAPEATLTLLKNHKTNDNDVKNQVAKIINTNTSHPPKKEKEAHSWEGNKDYEVNDPEKQLHELIANVQDSSKTEDAISKILSQINYSQIGIALTAIEDYPFKTQWKKYSFMERDWGFLEPGDFTKKETRDEFLRAYNRMTEYQLYAYYLDKAGIDYKTGDQLDYDKIYDLLKYDVVVAFAGGGGGKRDNEVYSLIKLLELTYKTTLGYPAKLCNSDNMWGCSSDERVQAWMSYLSEKNLLKQKHDEPVSFSTKS